MKLKPASHLKAFAKRHNLSLLTGQTDHEAVDSTSVWRQRGARDTAGARGLIDHHDVVILERRLPRVGGKTLELTICTLWIDRRRSHNDDVQLLFLHRQLPLDTQMMIKHLRHSWRHDHVNGSVMLYPGHSIESEAVDFELFSELNFSVELTPNCLTAIAHPALKTDSALESWFRQVSQLALALSLR